MKILQFFVKKISKKEKKNYKGNFFKNFKIKYRIKKTGIFTEVSRID